MKEGIVIDLSVLPKNREVLALIEVGGIFMWDIIYYARREDGVDKPSFVDRGQFEVREVYQWEELPAINIELIKLGQVNETKGT